MITVWSDNNPTRQTLPTPSKFEYTFIDVDKDSGRNDNGEMERNRVAQKVKLTISWNAQRSNIHIPMMKILQSLPPFFYCEYPDPNGSMKVIKAYRGDIKSDMYHYDSVTDTIYKQTNTSIIQR